jgi:hypothetical protein
MSTYRIRLDVEFQRGQVVRLKWENDSIQWSRLDKRVLRATVVRVRKDHFSFDAKVRDVTAGLFDPKRGKLCNVTDPKRIHAKSLVFILESPHKGEYHVINGKWTAREPLTGSRGVFETHLASVLKKLNLRDPIRIVLCNPVQWQASLHRFYLTKTRTGRKWKLQGSIRKQIWCQLWNYSQDGEEPVQANFVSRLLAYNPKFIINACSKEFRIPVGLLLGQYFNLKLQPYTVNHPSGWNGATNRVLVKGWYLPTDKNACELE